MAALKPRPKSAYAVCCGASARAAGVPGAYGGRGLGSVNAGFKPSPKLLKHALREASPYAEVAPPGWFSLEANVHPSWRDTGAGVISQGSVDNTYLPVPLQNAWGKSRELSKREVRKPPHKQCTDLLVVAKGYKRPAPPLKDMPSVRAPAGPRARSPQSRGASSRAGGRRGAGRAAPP